MKNYDARRGAAYPGVTLDLPDARTNDPSVRFTLAPRQGLHGYTSSTTNEPSRTMYRSNSCSVRKPRASRGTV
jgi:hypothetical protein